MIVVENLTKYYGAKRALDDISFTIESGEIVGFLGLNGAGKTTALKILSGLLLPSAGRFSVGGQDGQEDPLALRQRIGFLPDRPPVYEDYTVEKMVTYAARLNGVAKSAAPSKVGTALELTDLADVAQELVSQLSHGYRQRVGIAQAIVHDPPFVILDEPISGLDPVQIKHMRDLVRGLKARHTVLLSSHILQEISQTADRILVLNHGRIVAEGTEKSLGAQLRSRRVAVSLIDDLEVARTKVSAMPGDTAVEVDTDPRGVVVAAFEAEADQDIASVVSALVAQGLSVVEVKRQGGGLESIFLQLTEDAS